MAVAAAAALPPQPRLVPINACFKKVYAIWSKLEPNTPQNVDYLENKPGHQVITLLHLAMRAMIPVCCSRDQFTPYLKFLNAVIANVPVELCRQWLRTKTVLCQNPRTKRVETMSLDTILWETDAHVVIPTLCIVFMLHPLEILNRVTQALQREDNVPYFRSKSLNWCKKLSEFAAAYETPVLNDWRQAAQELKFRQKVLRMALRKTTPEQQSHLIPNLEFYLRWCQKH